MITIVVAIGSNYVIGKNNDLPWRGQLPADMARFKNITMGHPVIMGRNTYESIPLKFRPLANRTNIVLTSRNNYNAPGCIVACSLQHALNRFPSQQVFVIGGMRVYITALPLAQEIYLTCIHHEFDGDAKFPPINPAVWKECEDEHEDHDPDERNKYRYSFLRFRRRS